MINIKQNYWCSIGILETIQLRANKRVILDGIISVR